MTGPLVLVFASVMILIMGPMVPQDERHELIGGPREHPALPDPTLQRPPRTGHRRSRARAHRERRTLRDPPAHRPGAGRAHPRSRSAPAASSRRRSASSPRRRSAASPSRRRRSRPTSVLGVNADADARRRSSATGVGAGGSAKPKGKTNPMLVIAAMARRVGLVAWMYLAADEDGPRVEPQEYPKLWDPSGRDVRARAATRRSRSPTRSARGRSKRERRMFHVKRRRRRGAALRDRGRLLRQGRRPSRPPTATRDTAKALRKETRRRLPHAPHAPRSTRWPVNDLETARKEVRTLHRDDRRQEGPYVTYLPRHRPRARSRSSADLPDDACSARARARAPACTRRTSGVRTRAHHARRAPARREELPQGAGAGPSSSPRERPSPPSAT